MRGLRMKWGRGDPTATAAVAVAALHTMDGHCSSEKVGPPSTTRRAAAEGRGYTRKLLYKGHREKRV